MKVFVFDLVQYAENLDHLRVDGRLPHPMVKKYFKPEIAVRTYKEHLDAWVELERLGFDGVAINEHCHALWPDELAQSVGGFRGATDDQVETPDVREPTAAS
jgi:hypothetical protein